MKSIDWITNSDKLVGKTIARVVDGCGTSGSAFGLTFTDGSAAVLEPSIAYDSPELNLLKFEEAGSYTLLSMGLITEKEKEEIDKEEHRKWEKQTERAQRQQYEQLKKKFEP